jgi:hypothetical protein
MRTQTESAPRARLFCAAKWFRDAALISCGGWVLLAVAIWFLPASLVHAAPSAVGVCLGVIAFLGAAISAFVFWLVTGRDPMGALLGMEDFR